MDAGAGIEPRATDSDTEIAVSDLVSIAFLIWATFSVFLMIQGTGLFYAGLSRRKAALTQAAVSMVVIAVVQVQWFIWVYGASTNVQISSF